jgi:ABC-2 type transport system ATP-binding protein
MAVIETIGLWKRYRNVDALKGVSLKVEKGQIYGLLGQNGAGKSTLVKILLSIVRRSDGSAKLFDEIVGTTHIRRRVGYLPEDHRFPEYHTGFSLLDFFGGVYGMPRAQRRKRIEESLTLVGLRGRMHYKIRTYSKGMKQRMGIAQAIFHDPDLIILDEPTDGVDPIGRREIRQVMLDLKSRGKTIFLNSHLLGEVEMVTDRVGILARGVMIREGDIKTLTQQRGFFQIGLAPGQQLPKDELQRHGYVVQTTGEWWEVELSAGQTIDPVIDLLRSRGLSIRHLVEKRQSLEDIFMQAVEAAEPGIDAPEVKAVKREVRR